MMNNNIFNATAAAVNTILEHKASDINSINEVNNSTIITDVAFFDKEGYIVKRFFFFGLPETEKIEAEYDLTLGNIIKHGGSKKYENGSVIFVELKSIKNLIDEFEKEEDYDEFGIHFLRRYNEKQIINYFKKIMK